MSVPFEVLGAVMERKRHNYIRPSITEPDILQVVGRILRLVSKLIKEFGCLILELGTDF